MLDASDYGVKVVTAYSNMRVGNVIYPPGILRDRLVKAGYVVRLTAADIVKAEKAKAAK